MRKSCEEREDILVTIFIVVFVTIASPLILVWLIIRTIVDYFKYKKSKYYSDTHERYSWMCGESEHIVFYNELKKANLPVDYYRDDLIKMTGYGYFIFKNILILCDYDSDVIYFDFDNENWFVNGECSLLLEPAINDEIKKVNKLLGANVCERAILLVDSRILADVPEKHYENFEFLPVTNKNRVSALRNVVL